MKKITEELEKRSCIICRNCWHIFEGCARIGDIPKCPECGEDDSLRWITGKKPIV